MNNTKSSKKKVIIIVNVILAILIAVIVVICVVVSGGDSNNNEENNNGNNSHAHTHFWSDWILTTVPTCSAIGTEIRNCLIDTTHTETRSVFALGHDWGEWAITTPATATTDGVETRTCKRDSSHTETRLIPKTDLVEEPPVMGMTGTYRYIMDSGSSMLYIYTFALGEDGKFSYTILTSISGTVSSSAQYGSFTVESPTLLHLYFDIAPATAAGATILSDSTISYGGSTYTKVVAENTGGYASGNGTAANPYIISTVAQLNHFKSQSATSLFDNVYFALGANINLNNAEWTPIGTFSTDSGVYSLPFSGTFDGRGYKVSNFKITQGEGGNIGLFASNSGTIKNLGVENVLIDMNISATTYAGGLAGSSFGTVTNCYAISQIKINAVDVGILVEIHAGGLVGSMGIALNSKITECYAAGDLSVSTTGQGYSYVGGIIGSTGLSGTIKSCLALNNVSITTPAGALGSIGGVSGTNSLGGVYTNNYRYAGQVVYRKVGLTEYFTSSGIAGTTCTVGQINNEDNFYTAILGWDNAVWNLSGLDFLNDKYPTLKS